MSLKEMTCTGARGQLMISWSTLQTG